MSARVFQMFGRLSWIQDVFDGYAPAIFAERDETRKNS